MDDSLVLAVSDQAELRPLREWLAGTPSTRVTQESGTPAAGEQGTLDYVAVIASSGGLIAAIRMLPDFLRARRPELTVTLTVRGKNVVVDAKNIDEVIPLLEKLIDAE
jgi:membrane-associated two-gene conflict system component 1 (EACC1)